MLDVRAMQLMMCEDEPGDFVIATGEMHSVREFAAAAFEHAELGDFEDHVEIDPRYCRPTEVEALKGDIAKAREQLRWVRFAELVRIMFDADIEALEVQVEGQETRYSHEGTIAWGLWRSF